MNGLDNPLCKLKNCNVCKYNRSDCDYDCDSKEAVYQIQCKNCLKKYIGSTKRSIRTRIREHLQDIQNRTSDAFVACHFRRQCKIKYFTFKILFTDINNANERLKKEHDEMIRQETFYPKGLNERIPHYQAERNCDENTEKVVKKNYLNTQIEIAEINYETIKTLNKQYLILVVIIINFFFIFMFFQKI